MGILPFVVAAIVASLVLRRDDIKVYLYAMAGLAIIAFLIWGTFLLAKLLSVPIGLVDLAPLEEQRSFTKDILMAATNVLVSLGIGAYYCHGIRGLPKEVRE